MIVSIPADATEIAHRRGDSRRWMRRPLREGTRIVTAAESEVETWARTRDTEAHESQAMALPIKLPRERKTRGPQPGTPC